MEINIYNNPENMTWIIGEYQISISYGYGMHGTYEDVFGPRKTYKALHSVEVMVFKGSKNATKEFFPDVGDDPKGYVQIADLIDLLAKIKSMV